MVFDLHWFATEVGYCEPGRLDMIRGGIAPRSLCGMMAGGSPDRSAS